jgi:hypothetical protein
MFIEIEETAKEIGHGGLRTIDKVQSAKTPSPIHAGFRDMQQGKPSTK